MKKIIAILCAAFALAACTENLAPDSADRLHAVEETAYDGDIKLNLTITRADGLGGDAPDTKAIKNGWETGDVILVFIQKTNVHKYLELKYNGARWIGTHKNGLTEGEIANASPKKLRAIHLPYGSHVSPLTSITDYSALSYYDYFLESGLVDYTYSSTGGLTATLRMAAPQYTGSAAGKLIDFQVTGFDPSRTYYLNMKYLRKLHTDGILHSTLGLLHGAYELDRKFERLIVGRKDGDALHFTGLLDQSGVGTPVTFDFTILDQKNKIAYTRSVGPKTVNGNLSVDLGDISDATKWKATQYEDLGINNADGKRIYWGVYNLGASASLSNLYGDYFSWGYLQGYPLQGTFGNYTCEHKFVVFIPADFPNGWLDEQGCLTLEHDAAYHALGGAWRMPTFDELEQMYDNTTRSVVNNPVYGQASYGVTFTSKKSGYTNNSIFLPAAGFVHRDQPQVQGDILRYLSSNWYSNNGGQVRYFSVKTSQPDNWNKPASWSSYSPGASDSYGYPIRPVFTLQ